MIYHYKCTNEKCNEFNKEKELDMPMKDYSEDKLPNCECGERTSRVFGSFGLKTFGDGYKS